MATIHSSTGFLHRVRFVVMLFVTFVALPSHPARGQEQSDATYNETVEWIKNKIADNLKGGYYFDYQAWDDNGIIKVYQKYYGGQLITRFDPALIREVSLYDGSLTVKGPNCCGPEPKDWAPLSYLYADQELLRRFERAFRHLIRLNRGDESDEKF